MAEYKQVVLKRQNAKGFFHETFEEVFDYFGPTRIYICGLKMYIKLESKNVICIEFDGVAAAGGTMAFNNVILTAFNPNGIIDVNKVPFASIFEQNKGENGQDKIANLRHFSNMTGEYTMVWQVELNETDKMNMNGLIMDYIEVFN